MLGPPLVLSVIALALSYKKLVVAELIVPIELISMSIMFFVINFSGIIDEEIEIIRVRNMFIIQVCYFIFCVFITASWLFGFLIRVPTMVIIIASQILIRMLRQDEFPFWESITYNFLFFGIVELAIYLNIKAQLSLFQKVKIVEL